MDSTSIIAILVGSLLAILTLVLIFDRKRNGHRMEASRLEAIFEKVVETVAVRLGTPQAEAEKIKFSPDGTLSPPPLNHFEIKVQSSTTEQIKPDHIRILLDGMDLKGKWTLNCASGMPSVIIISKDAFKEAGNHQLLVFHKGEQVLAQTVVLNSKGHEGTNGDAGTAPKGPKAK